VDAIADDQRAAVNARPPFDRVEIARGSSAGSVMGQGLAQAPAPGGRPSRGGQSGDMVCLNGVVKPSIRPVWRRLRCNDKFPPDRPDLLFFIMARKFLLSVLLLLGAALPRQPIPAVQQHEIACRSYRLHNGEARVTGLVESEGSACEKLLRGPLAAQFYYIRHGRARRRMEGQSLMCTRDRELIGGRGLLYSAAATAASSKSMRTRTPAVGQMVSRSVRRVAMIFRAGPPALRRSPNLRRLAAPTDRP
jgi:hypothetical protein